MDSWVAFSYDESAVVAVADTYAEVVEMARQAGEYFPVLVKTPKNWSLI